jgi:biopolymer transport protein ExbB
MHVASAADRATELFASSAPAALDAVEMIGKGGAIGWTILALSVFFLTISVVLALKLRLSEQCPDELLDEAGALSAGGDWKGVEELVASDPSALAAVLDSLIRRRSEVDLRLEDVLAESTAEQTTILNQRVAYVGLIAAVAPMLGLFGTVSGMIKAFATISASPAAPDAPQLAGAISEALITTYLGLLVAMPALVVHTVLRHRVLAVGLRLIDMGEQFVDTLRRPTGRIAPAAVRGAAPRAR